MVLATEYPDLKFPKIINVGISGQMPRLGPAVQERCSRSEIRNGSRSPSASTTFGIASTSRTIRRCSRRISENVTKMVDLAQAAACKVILLSPTVIQEDASQEGNKRLLQYVAAEKKIAEEKKCQFVDLHEDVFQRAGQEAGRFKDKWLTADGVHMQPMGDAIMALGILRAVGVPDAKSAGAAASR